MIVIIKTTTKIIIVIIIFIIEMIKIINETVQMAISKTLKQQKYQYFDSSQ
jgi:hypothetical protein